MPCLRADPNSRDDRCRDPPVLGLRAIARVYAGWAYSHAFYRDALYRELGYASPQALLQAWKQDHLCLNANDLMAMLMMWEHADVAANAQFEGDFAGALATIRARRSHRCAQCHDHAHRLFQWQRHDRRAPGHQEHRGSHSPGLIYDVLSVSFAGLAAHRADYIRLIRVWNHAVSYINDPKTQEDAVQIMAARVELAPAQYQTLLAGTHLIDIAEGKKVFVKAAGLSSLYGSSRHADDFKVRNAVYRQPQRIESDIEPALTAAQP